ncbi:hypothetical protein VSU01S_14670 [Vibrio superstes NBRC 103154]|uniref:Uncharacterized protein n=1 Tax=Vibrio superstes NBRC 103154 TaxID=1219062 RepID=A0A511QRL7_9VIBR|nr:hypothetical protein VSU01S_14670 [Vibrio superstes NBRC 103154]
MYYLLSAFFLELLIEAFLSPLLEYDKSHFIYMTLIVLNYLRSVDGFIVYF